MQQAQFSSGSGRFRTLLPLTPFGSPSTLVILTVVVGLAILAAGLYFAPTVAVYGIVLLGLGTPLAVLLWRRPEWGLLVLLFLTSSFIQRDIVDLRLSIGGGLDLQDLVLIGLFGIVGLRELTRGSLKVPWWPVGGPLLLFLIIAVFSAFYAIVVRHVETNWALNDLRILSLYVTFFIVLWSIERPGQLAILLIGLFVIADLTTIFVYSQQFLGADNPILQTMASGRDWRVIQEGGGVRVVPAGHMLMHFMWFVALGLLVFARPNRRLRVLLVLQLLYIGGGHLLTYTRSQWVALALGLGLAGIILAPRFKEHLTALAAIALGVCLLLAGIVSVEALTDRTDIPLVTGIVERFGSILTPSQTSETDSLLWRAFENEKASLAISEQPLTGVGLGNRYRNLTTFKGEALGWWTRGSLAAGEVSRFTRYVHNSYMSIAVKMGVPGLLALLWFCAAALLTGFKAYLRMPDSAYKGVVLGLWLGFAGVVVWCYFHAHMIKAESTGVIGLMVGLIGSVIHLSGKEQLPGIRWTGETLKQDPRLSLRQSARGRR